MSPCCKFICALILNKDCKVFYRCFFVISQISEKLRIELMMGSVHCSFQLLPPGKMKYFSLTWLYYMRIIFCCNSLTWVSNSRKGLLNLFNRKVNNPFVIVLTIDHVALVINFRQGPVSGNNSGHKQWPGLRPEKGINYIHLKERSCLWIVSRHCYQLAALGQGSSWHLQQFKTGPTEKGTWMPWEETW